ncbi:hypothetical protein C0J52_13812, partial [Blattella germanica]
VPSSSSDSYLDLRRGLNVSSRIAWFSGLLSTDLKHGDIIIINHIFVFIWEMQLLRQDLCVVLASMEFYKSFASPEQKKSMLMPEHFLSTPSFVIFIRGGFAIHAVFAAAAEQAVVAVLVAAVDAAHGLFFVPRHDLLSRVFCSETHQRRLQPYAAPGATFLQHVHFSQC